MKTVSLVSTLRLVLFAAAGLLFTAPLSAVLIHDYDLTGTFADNLGGPSLVPNGGILGPDTYSFDPDQGLTLSNALPASGNYSILMDFSIASTGGYRRLIDFKNLLSDGGLYNLSTALNFYPTITGPADAFSADVPVRLVVTRDSGTADFTGYVNGLPQFIFNDAGANAVFDQPNAIMNFFIDDLSVGGEASAGVVDKISIYDTPLTAEEVLALGSAVPELGTVFFGISVLSVVLVKRSRALHVRKIS